MEQDDEGYDDDGGMMLSADDILQVIELGDEQHMNGNAIFNTCFNNQRIKITQFCAKNLKRSRLISRGLFPQGFSI